MLPSFPSGLPDAPRSGWGTHLYIVAIALAALAACAGPAPVREVLNSERIAAEFGSYGIEVLEQGSDIRVSNLYSIGPDGRTCRTFAIVRYPPVIDPAVSQEHATIVAGGSLGAVFAAQGWEVRKTHLSYGERSTTAKLAALMRIDVGTTLAEHVYVLDVVKDGRVIEYAALVEIHHPDYLNREELERAYGPIDPRRPQLVEQLRETAAERAR